VQRYRLGVTAPADNSPAIAAALTDLINGWRLNRSWPGFAEAQQRFEWRNLAGQMAAVFDRVTAEPRLANPIGSDR
jgi:hypothetical protein